MLSRGAQTSEDNAVHCDINVNQHNCPKEEGLLPYVKEEVKCFIQYRRHMEHKEEILIDKSPKQPDAPSIEDLEMQEDRRNRNNLAARKYRNKQKRKQDDVVKEHTKQMMKIKQLEKVINRLRTEKHSLINILKEHITTCCNTTLRVKSEELAANLEDPRRERTVQQEQSLGYVCQIEEFETGSEGFCHGDSFYEDNSWSLCRASLHVSLSDIRTESDHSYAATPALTAMAPNTSEMVIPSNGPAMVPLSMGMPNSSHWCMTQGSPLFETSLSVPSHYRSYQFLPSQQSPGLSYTSPIIEAQTLATSIDSSINMSSAEILAQTLTSRQIEGIFQNEQYNCIAGAEY